jgi:predicted nucleic acid-binding protein
MSIFTFESENSLEKIRGKIVVADTSYLISYSDKTSSLRNFHQAALEAGAVFYINVIIRAEFIKAIRKLQLIDAILKLVDKDPALEQRYRNLSGISKVDFTVKNLGSNENYNKIYKDHVRKDDLQTLLSELEGNIWQTVDTFERDGKFTFLGARQTSEIANADQTSGERRKFSWNNLGQILDETCLNSNDAMIVNFALSVVADAIVTTDSDFAQISDQIDIYMPAGQADLCKAYEPMDD